MNRSKFIILMLLFVLLASCGGAEEPASSSGESMVESDVEQPAATQAPTNEPEPTQVVEPEPTEVVEPEPTEIVEEPAPEEDEPLIVSDINSNYSTYNSYEVNVNVSLTDPSNGETNQFVEMYIQISVDPPAQQITMNAQGIDDSLGDEPLSIQMATVDGQTYMTLPEMGCITAPADGLGEVPFGEVLSADTFLDGLNNAQRVLPNETINGVEAKHYMFDESYFDNATAEDTIEGDLWIAVSDNRLVRLEMNGVGSGVAAPITGEADASSEFMIIYDVVSVDEPFEVEIPAECDEEASGEGSAYPLMEDAYEQSSFGGIYNYKTAAALGDVVTFYQEALPADGWSYDEGQSFVTEVAATMTFNREDANISVIVAPDPAAGDTGVTIMDGQP